MSDSLLKTRKRFRAEWTVLCAIALVAAALLGAALWHEHRDIGTQEADRLADQARVVDENLTRQLDGANKALRGVIREIGRLGEHADPATVSAQLSLLTDSMPGVSSMLMLDAEGTIVAASRADVLGKNFRQRDYFDVPARTGDASQLYVSPPFHSTIGNAYIVVVSRILTRANGEFAGVVTATLDPEYFNVLLSSVLYAPDMRAALIHADGKVFLDVSRTNMTSAGSSRIAAERHIDRAELHMNKPLVVTVSRDLKVLFQTWRSQAAQLGTMLALLLAASIVALHFNQKRRRANARTEAAVLRERQIGAERVELALRGADLGLWDVHVPSNDYVINAREREMLGFGPDDMLPQGAAWRGLIHPADRVLVDAAMLAQLRGDAPHFECEHRMWHRAGHWVWLSSRAVIVERDGAGAPIRMVGTHLDITERKESEARLAKAAQRVSDSEEQLRQVTDSLPSLVSRLDADLRLRFVNRAYRDWLQVDEISLLGCTLDQVYGDAVWQKIRHHFDAAVKGQRVVYERELTTPAGARRVEVTLVPQLDADGTLKNLYTLIHDITARHDAERRIANSEERLSLALEGSALALFDWNLATGTMYHSAQAAAMRGEPAIETTAAASELRAFIHPDDHASMDASIRSTVTGATAAYRAEYRVKHIDGSWRWLLARGRVVERGADGRAVRLAGTYADIHDRKVAEGQLRHLAEFDPLTDLPNRALFHDRLQEAMKRAARGKPMALLFLDIDHFKSVNDTLGHEAGDKLLKLFASRMTATVRQSDTVARLAGDEFTIILEGLNELSDAQMLAGKLVEALREPVPAFGDALKVSASIGVAWCEPGERDDAALLRRADAALYQAKRRGRDRFYCDVAGEATSVFDSKAGVLTHL